MLLEPPIRPTILQINIGIIIRSFPAIAGDNNAHLHQTHRSQYNVLTVGAMTFDRRQPGEGDGDVDAAISGISASHRSRAQAQGAREDLAAPRILTSEFPQSYFHLIDTTRWRRL
jgi:hypothetical protein